LADAPEVKIKLTAEDSGVAAAIKQLTSQLQTLKSKEAEVADSTLDLKEAFTGLIEVLAVEKILEFGKEVFDAGVKIARLAQVTGVSAETLSVYGQSAKDAGLEVADMQGGVSKLAVILTQAEQGNQKAAKSLALVGLTTKDFIGLNADQKIRKITDALGALPPGLQKVAAGTKLLGDANLIPAFTALAGEGFAKASEEAERFGNILSTQAGKDLLEAQGAMKDLEAAAEGAARQFETGLVPALTDVANAILNATSEKGGDGFRVLGEEAGVVIKGIAFGILSIGTSAGIAAAEVEEYFDFAFNHTKSAAKTAFAAIGGYIRSGIGGAAGDAALQLVSSQDAATKELVARIAAIEKAGEDQQKKIYDSLYGEKKTPGADAGGKDPALVNAEELKGSLKDQQQRDAIYNLRIAGLNKVLQTELTIEKAFADKREAAWKLEYEKGEISLSEYFDARQASLEKANARELENLELEKANEQKLIDRYTKEGAANAGQAKKLGKDNPVGQEFSAQAAKDQQEVIKGKEKLADLDAKSQILTEQNKAKQSNEDLARYTAEQQQLQKLAAFRKTILDIQGNTTESAKQEAAAKEAEFRKALVNQPGGASQESIDAEVQKYHELTTAVAAFNDQKKAGETAVKSLQDQEAGIQERVQSGQIFQIQADEQIRDLKASQIDKLRQIAALQISAAQASHNEADIQQAKDFKTSVDKIALEANDAATDLAKIKGGFQGSLQSSFENFFDSGIVKARTLGQAFAGLADSITGGLRKIVAGMLAQIATQKLLKAIPGLGGDANPAAKVASAAAAGTAQAAPITAAATALSAAGTLVVTGGTTLATSTVGLTTAGATLVAGAAALSAAAAQLQAAADTQLIADAAGGAAGAATGGLILGPGTGTSDSIPMRLSTGEFVMRAAAVKAIGAANLSAMNRGMRVAMPVSGAAPVAMAGGGLVGGTGGAASPHQVHLKVSLDEGIVMKHLKSNEAGKVVVGHLANNPKGAQKAIGRSS
jgi:hypothetical protein